MKYLIILLLLVSCSKSSVAPNATGHWAFSTTDFSGDFTLIKVADGYAVAPGGNFSFHGHQYVTGPQLNIPFNGTVGTVVLQTALVQNEASFLRFYMTASSNFSSVTGGNPITWKEFIPGQPDTNGDFNTKSFPITKQ